MTIERRKTFLKQIDTCLTLVAQWWWCEYEKMSHPFYETDRGTKTAVRIVFDSTLILVSLNTFSV